MRKAIYFKKGDILIYFFLISIFTFLFLKICKVEDIKSTKAEIYVDNKLKYVYPLTDEEKNIYVETEIGGVNIKIKDKKIRVTTSNSPRKLNVKQGWIEKPGEVIIGIPDKLLVKIVGEKSENNDVDFIIK